MVGQPRRVILRAGGRNGARSWRPGMAPTIPVVIMQGGWPQWSPVLETGNGRYAQPWGAPPELPQWSPVLETGNGRPRPGFVTFSSSRNGARSWRPGMAAGSVCGLDAHGIRRNGARSWRPGMGAHSGRQPGVSSMPQWSPVLETGNGDNLSICYPLRAEPQWSPVLETGNGCWIVRPLVIRRSRNGARSWRPGMEGLVIQTIVCPPCWPQWSPVLETGNGLRLGVLRAPLTSVPQWSPVLETGNGGPDCVRTPPPRPRRNGARSWRPGMAPAPYGAWPSPAPAAMEPGLGDREWEHDRGLPGAHRQAAMEPGLGDREWHPSRSQRSSSHLAPQWSPVLETGNGARGQMRLSASARPQWSPVLETGNGAMASVYAIADMHVPQWSPVLETGNGRSGRAARASPVLRPQWSPVLETGNGVDLPGAPVLVQDAAMEPGLGDREWYLREVLDALETAAAMEPGLGDREWWTAKTTAVKWQKSRNGARSWRPGMARRRAAA